MSSHVIEAPTVVKIDTEDYEAEVIKGMSAVIDSVRVLALEIHEGRLVGGASPQSIVESLTHTGFQQIISDRRGRQTHHLFVRS